jgi:hypothetical protein
MCSLRPTRKALRSLEWPSLRGLAPSSLALPKAITIQWIPFLRLINIRKGTDLKLTLSYITLHTILRQAGLVLLYSFELEIIPSSVPSALANRGALRWILVDTVLFSYEPLQDEVQQYCSIFRMNMRKGGHYGVRSLSRCLQQDGD